MAYSNIYCIFTPGTDVTDANSILIMFSSNEIEHALSKNLSAHVQDILFPIYFQDVKGIPFGPLKLDLSIVNAPIMWTTL